MSPPLTAHALAFRIMAGGAALLLASVLVFGLAPGLDLIVSGWFAAPGGGFPLSQVPAVALLREALISATDAVVAGCIVLGLLALVLPRLRARVSAAAMLFVGTAYALGPGVVANLILKDHWGRPRPRNVTDFGGDMGFVPALDPGGPCLRNCSFVSGEGSAFACLAIALLLLAWPRLGRAGRRAALAGAGAFVLGGSGLRVAFGGHFLSDTLFALAFMALLTPALWLIFVGARRGARDSARGRA